MQDRDGDVGLCATALTFTLDGNSSPCYIVASAPAHMRLKCRVVNGSSGGRSSAVTSRSAKWIKACMLAAQERRSACATLDSVDKRVKAFTSHIWLGRLLERGRGASGGWGGRSE